MPSFRYKARKPSGELITETIEAESPVAVAKRLTASGIIPISIDAQSDGGEARPLFERVTRTDVIMFTRQLLTLYKAGLPFLSSLDAIARQTSNPALRRVIADIRTAVEGGATLSKALARHPKVFPEMYVATVLAGETGGVLDQVMERLVILLEGEKETRQTIRAAIRYPLTVIGAMAAAFVVIITFVIPRFAVLFSKMGQNLPLPTRVLIGLNDLRQDYWHAGLGLAAALIAGAVWYVRTPQGRLRWDKLALKFPLVGSIIMKASMARLAHMFGTLSQSGLPILKELQVISRTLGNRRISQQIDAIREAVREGSNLATAVDTRTDFPPLVKHMMAVGEKTGAMYEMMEAVGEHYDRETRVAISRLTQAIEPLITVVLGVGLLFMALAVFLPMWDMMSVMGQ
jgi:type II secretory pathway component PulF